MQRREVKELSELPFALPDLLLRPLALGDVDQGTHELNEIAGWAENRVAYYVDISDLAAGMNDSVVQLELRPFALCSLERFRGPGLIIRMNALKECFESWLPTLRVETQQAVAFLGPVPNVARRRGPCPTSRVTEPLRFC